MVPHGLATGGGRELIEVAQAMGELFEHRGGFRLVSLIPAVQKCQTYSSLTKRRGNLTSYIPIECQTATDTR